MAYQDLRAYLDELKKRDLLRVIDEKFCKDTEIVPLMSMGGATWKMESTEKVRAIGGLWTVAEGNLNMGGMSVTAILTLGFDPRQDLFVGTYVDSTTPYLWSYIGTLDKSGKALILDTKGPSFDDPEKMARYREVITIKSADVRTFSSSFEDGKGGWTTFMTAESRRKK